MNAPTQSVRANLSLDSVWLPGKSLLNMTFNSNNAHEVSVAASSKANVRHSREATRASSNPNHAGCRWLGSLGVIGGVGLSVIAGCSDRMELDGETTATTVPTTDLEVDAGPSEQSPPASVGTLVIVSQDPPDLPLPDLNDHWEERFALGDAAFDHVFRTTQGLGPIYIRQACASCHAQDARGPGASRKMVNVEADRVTPAADQSMFPYGHTIRPQSIDPDTFPGVTEPAPFNGLLVSSRLGPAVFGRGAMEAVLDGEIERLEAEQSERSDGISGRIHRVTYESEANPDSLFNTHAKGDTGLIGRFGLKARIATLDEFAADAYQGDMGITSPLRPDELPNPAGATDDGRAGLDIDLDTVNMTGDYVRTLRIPARRETSDEGRQLFDDAKCSVCHATGLQTQADYPVAPWANTRVDVYTDLLLHAMGKDLADGMTDGNARGDEWRTAPLIGVRHLKGLLHDGRAKDVREAILGHASEGSEANGSVDAFKALNNDDQALLIEFVTAL